MPEITTLGYQIVRTIDPYEEMQNSVRSRAVSAPPVSPAPDDRYIVGFDPTGAWAGQSQAIATFDAENLAWRFRTPSEGLVVWVDDENRLVVWDGAGWANVDPGESYTAGEAISALHVVRTAGSGRVVYARPPEVEALTPLGVSMQSGASGARITVARDGVEVVDGSWRWTPGKLVLLGPTGTLTQTQPVGAPYLVAIGRATTSYALVVRIGQPIKLAL